MESLDWKDAPEASPSSKQNLSSFKASTATPWFGATVFLVSLIIGFVIGNFINL